MIHTQQQFPRFGGTFPKEREAMKSMKRIAVIAMAIVAASVTSAPAGTKYAANLVSNSPDDSGLPPTLSPKGQLKLSDKGAIQVSLAGVVEAGAASCVGGTNAGGACTVNSECPMGDCVTPAVLANSSTLYNDTKDISPELDGSEYIVILKIVIPFIAGTIPVVEVPIPVDLAKGKGKTKLNASALFGLIPQGAGRTLEIIGAEVWGPLGASNAANCQATVVNGFFPGSPDPSCRGGNQIGMSGIAIPAP